MNSVLQNDLLIFPELLEAVKNQGISFLDTINDRDTSGVNTIKIEQDLNQNGLGALEVLKEFNNRFDAAIVASSGPRYWGYVTGGATPAAIVGDWLASVYDQNTQGAKNQGDISAVIEFETIQLLCSLFQLPDDFLGGFVTGATMSNFTCLGVARQWVGKQVGKDFAKDGISEKIEILSATPHSSAVKSLAMLGLGSNNITKIKIETGNREAINIEDLKQQIENLKGKPFVLISSAGTVNTVDYDNFKAIASLKKHYKFWWHIDAAFGAFAACSPKYKHVLEGWELADSITVDCHKWLNVPYESAFYLIKKEHSLLQVETFQNSNAPYLGDPLDNFNYLNFLPENSRRLKALPAWFTLKAYGKKGYEDIVEKSVEMASLLGGFVEESPFFELLAPVYLNTVCFTLKGNEAQAAEFLKEVNDTGKVFMTPTIYKKRKGIRAAIVNWRTNEKDIEIAINVLKEIVNNYKK